MNIKDAMGYFALERYGYIEFDTDDDKCISFVSPERDGAIGVLNPEQTKQFFMSMALRYQLDGLGQWVELGEVDALKTEIAVLKKRMCDFVSALDKASESIRNDGEESLLNMIWDAIPDAD